MDVLEYMPVVDVDGDTPMRTSVTISNVVPKRDRVTGEIVNAHDGAVVLDKATGVFYLCVERPLPLCTTHHFCVS